MLDDSCRKFDDFVRSYPAHYNRAMIMYRPTAVLKNHSFFYNGHFTPLLSLVLSKHIISFSDGYTFVLFNIHSLFIASKTLPVYISYSVLI